MEENNRTEIDIIEILIKIYLYILKYKWFFVIAIAFSIIYSFLTFSLREDRFESSMVIKTDIEKNYMYAITFQEFQNRFEQNPGELIVKVLNSANSHVKNGNLEKLSNRTKVDTQLLKSIKSISTEYKYIKGEPASNYISVNVSASNINIFNTLGEGIINYINSNKSIRAKHQRDSVFLKEVIIRLDKKINELDSLQNDVLKRGSLNKVMMYNENSFYAENIMLSALREQLLLELKELNQTGIIEDFYIPKTNPKILKKVLISNAVIFIFISVFLVFILIINRKANEYKKRIRK